MSQFHKPKVMRSIDLTSAESVQIIIGPGGTQVWVNVNDVCLFRAYRIGHLTVDDQRATESPSD